MHLGDYLAEHTRGACRDTTGRAARAAEGVRAGVGALEHLEFGLELAQAKTP